MKKYKKYNEEFVKIAALVKGIKWKPKNACPAHNQTPTHCINIYMNNI